MQEKEKSVQIEISIPLESQLGITQQILVMPNSDGIFQFHLTPM